MTDTATNAPGVDRARVVLRTVTTQPANVHEAALIAASALTDAYGGGWSIALCDGRRWTDLVGRGAALSELAEGVRVVRVPGPEAAREDTSETVRAIESWIRLIAERDRYRVDLDATTAEAESQSDVAHEILEVRDLEQVLLSIVNRTLVLLDSDICGVLLRDGDVIKMTACVGHRMVETAHLRMQRGQGLAGLVFEQRRHGVVDSYADDRTISADFIPLAGQEDTRSALAVPLLAHDDVIGVLEVWRRRDSVFTETDVRRMIALGSLATIAIENARLYDLQKVTLARLSAAHEAMEHQVALLDRTSRLQNALVRVVLDRTGAFDQIMRTVADEFSCGAAYVRRNGTLEASAGDLGDDDITRVVPAVQGSRTGRAASRHSVGGDRTAWTHPVVSGDQEIGWVVLVGGTESDEAMAAAAAQVAMACALARLEQRAASQARNAAYEQIVWDLVEGPPEHRSAALSRASELGIALHGAHRVVQGGFDNLGELAREKGWHNAAHEDARRAVLRAVRAGDTARRMRLLSMRGDWIVAIVGTETAADARETVGALREAAATALPGLRMTWGASSAYTDLMMLPTAYREAVTALDGARRMRPGQFSLYDELGIVRLLLGSGGDNPDLQTFVDDVTGPLREYDRKHDGSLVQTLRAFFDNDCSQRRAADALFIHPKTLSYRLAQISELSALDLTRHDDRMRADLALRMLQLSEQPGAASL
ncbi:MAG: helix-turn-helix domain-containing protein [Microbacterium sp.]|uniref:helix-turn-helix domain-containing protein n=1 Tax=Microbacterium sp. TaxID=51671 RepID=UPI001AC624F1|nr:helix-turn-helix domain-containing protein [Microbacterium sp.]MBN9176563.1 helix-turn-helix domain-containing protein [Microbacterium sp.]